MNAHAIAKLAHSALRQLVDARRECERFNLSGWGGMPADRVQALEKCIHLAEHNVRELLTLLDKRPASSPNARNVTITLDPPKPERPHLSFVCEHLALHPNDGGESA